MATARTTLKSKSTSLERYSTSFCIEHTGKGGLLIMGGLLVVGRLLGWTPSERAGAAMASGVGNSAFLALPVTAAVLGPETARLVAGALGDKGN